MMAQSFRSVKSRIRSVENIKKITRAMEMVSVAKLRSLQRQLASSQEYHRCISRMCNNLLASFEGVHHPLLEPHPERDKILLCVVASDTGLCGSYNGNVIHEAEDFIRTHTERAVSLMVIGKKGLANLRKHNLPIVAAYTDLYGHYSNAFADKISGRLIDAFTSGEADEVYIAYTSLISASRVKPVVEKILNVEKSKGEKSEYLVEPGIQAIMDELIPFYVTTKVRSIILGAFTAENSTRVMAMHEATENAKELLEDLVLLRNKMRQADITREIIEVVSSADALKG